MKIQQIRDAILQVCSNSSANDVHLFNAAFEQAEMALKDKTRENGDPFLCHGLGVALILVREIGLLLPAATAILLHESFKHTKITELIGRAGDEMKQQKKFLDAIAKQYGTEIAQMVCGMNKISSISLTDTKLSADNLRKFLVMYSEDPRVTIIKLADRLEVMRSLDFFPKNKQEKKATETLLLYAPLAHQLGMYNLKTELEDLSLRYTEPESYRLISNKLKISGGERQQLINEFLAPVEAELKKQGIVYEIKSRTKSVYSIWRKMQAQKVDFEKIYDIFAIRIIINAPKDDHLKEEALCWEVYTIIENLYEIAPHRTRNWLSKPKSNGYEALHVTATTQDKPVEVQIRTIRMNELAEAGRAAHWIYKGMKGSDGLQQWLDNVKELLEKPAEYKHDFSKLKADEIFVFTPARELRRLPANASVLDFAFAIHTNIGFKCAAGLVNGRHVSIKEKLTTGDVVEVITAKNQKPTLAWLDYVVASKARSKIKQKLVEEETKKYTEVGKELLIRRLKNWKMEYNDEVLALLLKYYKLKAISDLYVEIAKEKINIADIREVLTEGAVPVEKKKVEKPAHPVEKIDNDLNYLVVEANLGRTSYKLAKCCKPMYGDEVFGFVTINEGIKIHRVNCPNAARLLDNYDYRKLKVHWVPKK
ncbi:MAG: HD domain-containing protein [Prevotellaceae bacterium]|jgi:GTP pyrophosphokinase|nr:HD domain-containing protein [Prevotellaceae bacterium]